MDLQSLNKSVLREFHPLLAVDELLAQMHGVRVFSKLDANKIPLAKKSQLLTTFITPYGRHCFKKLPFGISSGLEHFQKGMSLILEGMDGVLCLIDDALIFGRDREEHDSRLKEALKQIQRAGVTLNPDKCEFNKTKIVFLGHLISESGIQPDPEKNAAIAKIKYYRAQEIPWDGQSVGGIFT